MSRSAKEDRSLPLRDALQRSEPLGRLMQRLRASQACLDAVRSALPEGLRDQVRPGPLDEEGWSLLVPHGAAAAKVRQCLPTLLAALQAGGHGVSSIRVRIQPSAGDA
jgi:hypothetical protein